MELSWKSYRLMDKANVFVAAALSLGILPENFRLSRGSNGRIEWEFSAYEDNGMAELFRIHRDELQERVTVLEAVRWTQKLVCDDDHQMVSLSKYAQWTIDNEIEPLAKEFIEFAISNTNSAKSKLKPTKAPERREKKSTLQDEEVLRILREVGYIPQKLPPMESGRPWVKAEVKPLALKTPSLFGSEKVFDTTWERLNKSGQLKQKS